MPFREGKIRTSSSPDLIHCREVRCVDTKKLRIFDCFWAVREEIGERQFPERLM
jgi:hypothetical protein